MLKQNPVVRLDLYFNDHLRYLTLIVFMKRQTSLIQLDFVMFVTYNKL